MSKDLKGKRLRLSAEEVEMVNEFRGADLDNFSGNTALDLHLKDRGILKKDVVSVKHWQSASGELRFSIVTKEDNSINESEIFNRVEELIEQHSPYYPRIKRDTKANHLLVINPADIHIGKYANEIETGDSYDSETACKRVLEGVEGLLSNFIMLPPLTIYVLPCSCCRLIIHIIYM